MKEAEELLKKYRAGLCTPEEVQLLQKWFHHLGEDEVSELSAEDLIAAKLKFERALKGSVSPVRSYRLWARVAGVAAAVVAVVFGLWFFNSRYDMNAEPGNEVAANDIAPGKNGATITMANGKVIQLSDAKSGVVIGSDSLKYNDNTSVTGSLSSGIVHLSSRANAKDLTGSPEPGMIKGVEAQALTAATARGQTYQFTLPDGTKVWLNSDSKLEFPSSFMNSKTRNVKLYGEGYFEVAKDRQHPFMVETERQSLEVLGTHFNINSYADAIVTTTTLLEGSVKIRAFDSATGRTTLVLKPNQQSILNSSGAQVLYVDVNDAVAWKNGYFRFRGEQIQPIMQQLARWYDIEVSYQGKMPLDGFNGKVSRNKNISQVLKALEAMKIVHFKVEGRRVTVIN